MNAATSMTANGVELQITALYDRNALISIIAMQLAWGFLPQLVTEAIILNWCMKSGKDSVKHPGIFFSDTRNQVVEATELVDRLFPFLKPEEVRA